MDEFKEGNFIDNKDNQDHESAEIIPKIPSNFDVYKELRSEVTYEAGLITSRTGWLLSSQAFLFTSLAAGVRYNDAVRIQNSVLYPLVPIAGILLCGLTIISVGAALKRAKMISEHINMHHRALVFDNRIQEDPLSSGKGSLSAIYTPYVFLAAWSWIILPSIRNLIMKL